MLSKAHGVATIFNVVNLKAHRGRGIGKALSAICVSAAASEGYRYVLLQASSMGAPVYKALGFTPLPPFQSLVKTGHISLFCGAVERYIRTFGFTKTPLKISAAAVLLLVMLVILRVLYAKFLQ
jgi:GNAT superfamily N-acetyltransferase